MALLGPAALVRFRVAAVSLAASLSTFLGRPTGLFVVQSKLAI